MANKKVQFTLTAIDKTKAAFDRVGKGLKIVGGGAKMASMGVAKVGLAAADPLLTALWISLAKQLLSLE